MTMQTTSPTLVPYIPDNAPFNNDQRAWLNGFLAGIFSSAQPAIVTEAPLSLKIAVLYASQSGTAEGLARKVAKDLKSKGHIASLISLEGYTPAALAEERYAILIASTYGDGDAPDAVKPFYEKLCIEHFPRYQDLSYAVLALGDSHYEHFCKFGIDLDNKLDSLGAVRLHDRIDCDVDLDDAFTNWKQGLYSRLESIVSTRPAKNTPPPSTKIIAPTPKTIASETSTSTYTRENPFLAPLVDKHPLTREVSSKLTMHMAFSIADSNLKYEAGDACGVVPQNDYQLVGDIITMLNFSPQAPVQLPKAGTTTLIDALTNHLQITRLTRKMIEAYATIGNCKPLFGLLVPEQQAHLEKYTCDRGLIDLLHDYPGVLHNPADLVAMLPRLAPRLYSISSSPYAHAGEIHTTIAVVRYRSHNRERGGVCSTLLADRTNTGERRAIYIQPNKKFRLPQQSDAPIIMIGPGTGIAPFRAFLHQRRALSATGKNWLFFGERSAATDFLYRDELESMLSDKHLTHLDLAFSRDQEHKVYVQDKMLEQAPRFWSWLQDGASIYVCGDAARMAKDVDATLRSIVAQQGNLDAEAATEYVQTLKDDHRYHRDVY
ncbi:MULTISPECIES: sulfite reductase flavoprotein subunit alpha [Acidobacteriaceae]|uniref:diflavin oxidoreductase n=1 Tax=Acidobacteriaceae TaxID=204434 RepID=UPI0020B1783C|nr:MULTISPECIES: flavodoxin domain-containing protein [Acidobacteriaceae]MDW5264556.1 flavodoxin domain-containing protein [Edaphobacter sp.]